MVCFVVVFLKWERKEKATRYALYYCRGNPEKFATVCYRVFCHVIAHCCCRLCGRVTFIIKTDTNRGQWFVTEGSFYVKVRVVWKSFCESVDKLSSFKKTLNGFFCSISYSRNFLSLISLEFLLNYEWKKRKKDSVPTSSLDNSLKTIQDLEQQITDLQSQKGILNIFVIILGATVSILIVVIVVGCLMKKFRTQNHQTRLPLEQFYQEERKDLNANVTVVSQDNYYEEVSKIDDGYERLAFNRSVK